MDLLGGNPAMRAVLDLVGRVAQTSATILIEGETGTGKGHLARAIHEASPRSAGPFITAHCAAVPQSLLESELFGHERGAFTDAACRRKGRFELADGGTLFLDEVGDTPPAMQAQLLRVLQERPFERVGGAEPVEVDVRLVAASNRPLRHLVEAGKFRADLYYRLNVVRIELPPLRDRAEDIPPLARHFLKKYARAGEPVRRLAPEALEALLAHRWPGNVRELENAIERACVLADGGSIRPEHLALGPPRGGALSRCLEVDLSHPLPGFLAEATAAVETQYLRKALRQCQGHVGRAAALCGLSRRSLSAKLTKYRLRRAFTATGPGRATRPPPDPRPG
jgi:DNA-binding NtrC family response regulator